MKVYIATALTNAAEHNRLRDALAARAIGLTYDWTAHGSVWREGPDRIRQVAAAEAAGVVGADVVVVLLPGGRGTHAELGIAIGAGVPVLLIPQGRGDYEGEGACAFYSHPGVTIAGSRDFERIAEGLAGVDAAWDAIDAVRCRP